MTDIRHIHRQAMEQSDLAIRERMKGDEQAAQRHLQHAYELEADAANALLTELTAEPARSVLFRSAATLARDCARFSDAEKLIHKALARDPPDEIAEELRDLLEQVSFQRHLELSEKEVQMSIAGKVVGFGIAPTKVFLRRVESTENLPTPGWPRRGRIGSRQHRS
jgi:hypothetical protein